MSTSKNTQEIPEAKASQPLDRASLLKAIQHERTRRKQLDKATSELSLAIEERKGQVTDLDAQIADVKKGIEQEQAQCSRLEHQFQEQEEQIEAFKNAEAEQQKVTTQLKRVKAKLKNHMRIREEEQSSWEEYESYLKANIKQLSQEMDAVRDQEAEVNPPASEDLFKDPAQLMKEMSDLRDLEEQYDAQVITMKKSLQELNEEIKKLEELKAELPSQVDSASSSDLTSSQQPPTRGADPSGTSGTGESRDVQNTKNSISDRLKLEDPVSPNSISSEFEPPSPSLGYPEMASQSHWDAELEALVEQNEAIRAYIDRLLSRIVDLEEFQIVLHRDFDSMVGGQASEVPENSRS
ncbi:hypothetical protein DFH28DRAFT_1022602 [Melampsora americana]|nr:hypothetical protein DFH28DRAFT_1022602 [Melampsora americana]